MSALFATSDDRLLDDSQSVRDILVERRDPVADIDEEHDDRGRLDRDLNLPFDIGREVVDIDDADAAGVDQFEEPVAGFDSRWKRGRASPRRSDRRC